MNIFNRLHVALAVMVMLVAGCAGMGASDGWITLIDGEKGLENFERIGDANWRAEGGAMAQEIYWDDDGGKVKFFKLVSDKRLCAKAST